MIDIIIYLDSRREEITVNKLFRITAELKFDKNLVTGKMYKCKYRSTGVKVNNLSEFILSAVEVKNKA